MAIDTKNLSSIQAYQTNLNMPIKTEVGSNKANDQVTQTDDKTSQAVTQTTIRNEKQASLVAHLFGDGSSTQESSLKLTFQAAIEKLNEVLMADMPTVAEGETAVSPISEEALTNQGGMEYWTPENTAKRIVDGATAFFNSFQAANPDLEGEALMDRFMEVVGGGLTKGFDEAKGILGDLKVFEGQIAENVDTTYQLVQDGMLNFKNQYLGIEPTPVNESEVKSTTV